MRAAVYTLGCKVNQCESEALADAFYTQGFSIVHYSKPAEIVVVNTCTVTSKAEQKARRMIRKFAAWDHSPTILVTGCYAEMDPEELRKLPGSIIVIPLILKPDILLLPTFINDRMKRGFTIQESIHEWIKNIGNESNNSENPDPAALQQNAAFNYKAVTFLYHARAFLKIEDGCDNACSYCRVTLARGKAVSIDRDEALLRALALEKEGYREIVLTGVNITAYHSKGEGLEGLLRELLAKLTSTKIRLSSLEPDMITDDLIALCGHELIQPHFHIPVQSGSNAILASVNRYYTTKTIISCVDKLRKVKTDPFVAADVISGLPGETDDDARKTYQLLEKYNFSQLHVFPFSPRPGTDLYKSGKKVAEYIRDQRAEQLRKLSANLHQSYIKRWAVPGREVSVLLENRKQKYWTGLSDNYLRFKIAGVPIKGSNEGEVRGSLSRVKIVGIEPESHIISEFVEFI
ncbi:MAG: tRNA (N(6)-L-threonylcarbamoyladenosine(37)-C(2))-methylthiotransferase MtaB [Spirochaetales bacterium]|nr:tRNA (N(6)-L-threonylcarbamoyladenosine(37)-C(2))-methylthiotransferase MtaB [Spirochaetales bacterium]